MHRALFACLLGCAAAGAFADPAADAPQSWALHADAPLAPAADTADTPAAAPATEGVPHLSSPQNLPPGTTTEPATSKWSLSRSRT